MEEMGLKATWIAEHPSYFLTCTPTNHPDIKIANVVYETTLEHYNFTPSDECVAIDWVSKENADQFNLFPNAKILVEQFNPARH